MSKSPHRLSNKLNAICFLVSMAVLLWLMRSGALAIWDRHSPVKEAPVLPWIIAVPAAVVGGLLLMPILTFQISALFDWWRNRRGE